MIRLLCTCVLAFALLASVAASAGAGKVAKDRSPRVMADGQTEADLKTYLRGFVPRFDPPVDRRQWIAQAERLRRRVLDEVVFRGVPKSWREQRPRVVWGETIIAEGYFIRKLRYEAVPGLWIGALLYEPANLKGKVPAVLNPNGHVGKPGMTVDYKQARCINLVKRGMLALNLEWIGMGQLSGPGYGHSDLAYLDLCGRAGLSVFYLELKRGLDILCSHKHADRKRIAVTGLSGGGWQTIVISSLDPRVKLAAPNAGYIALGPRIEYRADTGDLEQNASDLVSVADYVHLTALLAPRPALLIYNAKDDCCFPAERALESVYSPVVPVYRLFERLEHFAYHVNHDPGTHNYLKDNREAFYRFINRHFLPTEKDIDEDLPVENEVRSSAALAISYPPDNANFHTLAAELMRSLPTTKPPASGGKAMERWREETRNRLREVVRPEPDLAVDPDPAVVTGFSDEVQSVAGKASLLRLGGRWTLPVIVYEHKGGRADKTVLTITDRGIADARGIVAEALGRGERAVVLDVLFTGECVAARGAGHWAQMIGTVGRRPLGIQVSQLRAVAEWIVRGQAGKPLQVVTKGRVAGLAALVCAALHPQSMDSLELREMDKSLKDLLASKVTYSNAPSLFCFGLLAVADIPELAELARPTNITGPIPP